MVVQVEWLSEAMSIGDRLQRWSRRAADGCPIWLKTPKALPPSDRPRPLGPHLYAGASGVTLFLAALARATGEEPLRELTIRALVPVRRRLADLVQNARSSDLSSFKLGGGVGLGSLIYGFTRIGLWLEEPSLLEEAGDIASLITPHRIASGGAVDVLYGTAGLLLSLLALDREAPVGVRERIAPLARAVDCGEHLLQRRTVSRGFHAWPNNGGGAAVGGFAHGAAGIAFALQQLAARTQRDDFRQAALEGFAFERSLYCPKRNNWASVPGTEDSFMMAWCNGAPGIALALLPRSASDAQFDDLRGDLEHALEATRNADENPYDFLCCGNFGRVEILLQASRALGRDDLQDVACELGARALSRISPRWSEPGENGYNPTFFRGAAGIGYSLLRLATGGSLPCVLALE